MHFRVRKGVENWFVEYQGQSDPRQWFLCSMHSTEETAVAAGVQYALRGGQVSFGETDEGIEAER